MCQETGWWELTVKASVQISLSMLVNTGAHGSVSCGTLTEREHSCDASVLTEQCYHAVESTALTCICRQWSVVGWILKGGHCSTSARALPSVFYISQVDNISAAASEGILSHFSPAHRRLSYIPFRRSVPTRLWQCSWFSAPVCLILSGRLTAGPPPSAGLSALCLSATPSE